MQDRISELHGNSNREYCKECGKEYIRGTNLHPIHPTLPNTTSLTSPSPDFRAVAPHTTPHTDHRTGRKCSVPSCSSPLYDTIINFGESLPEPALSLATSHARKADLCLVLGSSCLVSPANSIPRIVGESKKGKLAICNLQETGVDDVCGKGLRVWGRTDEVMGLVMEELGIEVPGFRLRRRVVVDVSSQRSDRHQITVRGVDVDGTPASFLKGVKVEGGRRVVRTEPFVLGLREELSEGMEIRVEMEFMGHYGEPSLVVGVAYPGEDGGSAEFGLEYDVWTKTWEVRRL